MLLVSGGGIAGVLTSVSIAHFCKGRDDIKIDIYEQGSKFSEIGAGVGFWLRPWKVMKEFGMEESLAKLLGVSEIDEGLSK